MQKILIFSNNDSHFYHHLLPIALEAKKQGYKVCVLTKITKWQEKIEAHGLRVIDITLDRKNLNPFKEIMLLFKLIQTIYAEKPDILHNFTIKPILYGSIAGGLLKTPQIVNNFLGLGYVFINNNFASRALRKLICTTLSFLGKFKPIKFIAQNQDDRNLLVKLKIAPEDLIFNQCSVGVDLNQFPVMPEAENPQGVTIFALVSRMLKDKGVVEFIEAAKILKAKNLAAEFWLVGEPDKGNPASVSEEFLIKAEREGIVKYLGFRADIVSIWKKAHVAVLPSYREGLSRSLLEAGSCQRAVITTDAPGGSDLIQDQVNGLLVKAQDSMSLAQAMELLCASKELRKQLAANLQKHIEANYTSEIIAKKMLQFYR